MPYAPRHAGALPQTLEELPTCAPPSGNPRGLVAPLVAPPSNPSASLVESLGPVVDDLRQLSTDFGLRAYTVHSIVVQWSGGAVHRGDPAVVFDRPFVPTPKVENMASTGVEMREAGAVERGTVRVTGISPRLTENEIYKLFPSELGPGEEHFIEVRVDSRDGNTERRRYIVNSVPQRRPDRFDWLVTLYRQDENRTLAGRPR